MNNNYIYSKKVKSLEEIEYLNNVEKTNNKIKSLKAERQNLKNNIKTVATKYLLCCFPIIAFIAFIFIRNLASVLFVDSINFFVKLGLGVLGTSTLLIDSLLLADSTFYILKSKQRLKEIEKSLVESKKLQSECEKKLKYYKSKSNLFSEDKVITNQQSSSKSGNMVSRVRNDFQYYFEEENEIVYTLTKKR